MHVRRARLHAAVVVALATLLASACSVAHDSITRTTSGPTSRTTGTPSWAIIPSRTAHRSGELLSRTIPGGASRFPARKAEIYLPPAALDHPRLRLPVLELLHGTPGSPLDWVNPTLGNVAPELEAFARSHSGRTPIVVMPDINGTYRADTECYRTKSGANVEQYLADIVPAWIRQHLPAATSPRDWAVAGLSEGGTCALMLALRHRNTFRTIGDFSGLAHLSVSDGDDYQRTLRELFDGNVRAYNAYDPLRLLTRGASLVGTGLWLQCGAKDRDSIPDQALIAKDARAVGATVRSVLYPGLGHRWPVWTDAVRKLLPWWWQRMAA